VGELSRRDSDRGIPGAGMVKLNRFVLILGESGMHLSGNLGVHERLEEVNWIKEVKILGTSILFMF
jgi:hypothetical protein